MQVMDPVPVMKLSISRTTGNPRPRMHGRGLELQGRSIDGQDEDRFAAGIDSLVRALEDEITKLAAPARAGHQRPRASVGGCCPNNFSSDRTARARLTITRAIGFRRIEVVGLSASARELSIAATVSCGSAALTS